MGNNTISTRFRSVKIRPHFGALNEATGKMPHPLGYLSVILKRKGNKGIYAEIILPRRTQCSVIWNDEKINLKSGKQVIDKMS